VIMSSVRGIPVRDSWNWRSVTRTRHALVNHCTGDKSWPTPMASPFATYASAIWGTGGPAPAHTRLINDAAGIAEDAAGRAISGRQP
jgi:hypothetical protein